MKIIVTDKITQEYIEFKNYFASQSLCASHTYLISSIIILRLLTGDLHELITRKS